MSVATPSLFAMLHRLIIGAYLKRSETSLGSRKDGPLLINPLQDKSEKALVRIIDNRISV